MPRHAYRGVSTTVTHGIFQVAACAESSAEHCRREELEERLRCVEESRIVVGFQIDPVRPDLEAVSLTVQALFPDVVEEEIVLLRHLGAHPRS